MSSYMVLAAVSGILRRTLWDSFQGDSVIQPIVGSESAIVFTNPTETARDSSNRLSLWLYQVTENEHIKNNPPLRQVNQLTRSETPLSLNLYYLVTPFAASGESDHLLLGRTMQAFYDNAILHLRRPPDDISEELRIIFCRLTLEELTRIWDALREPYRLSVAYQVRVTTIDSQRTGGQARVVEYGRDYGGELGAAAS
jgi:hypothetical protein